MRPILFELNGFEISSYSFFAVLGIMVAQVVFIFFARKEGISLLSCLVYVFLIMLLSGAIFSSILYKVLLGNSIFDLDTYKFWLAGRSSICGAFSGVLITYVFVKRNKINFWKFADTVAPAIAIGASIGKVGCLLEGCCAGKCTGIPVGIMIDGCVRHPTQIYQSLSNFIIFILIIVFRKREKWDGQVFLVSFGIMYPLMRIIVEPFRNDTLTGLNDCPVTTMIATVSIVISFLVYNFKSFIKKREKL